jgi:23S rRNA (guanosine2251-2'-O)-methyltransferase
VSRKSGTEELIRFAGDMGLPFKEVEPVDLGRMAGHGKHQGVLLECGPLPTFSIDEILRFESSGGGDLLLMTTGIEDPRNLGAIVRCGLFLGARAMLVPSRGSAPLSPTVSRTSSGALESMPMVMVSGAVNACQRLNSEGYEVVGVELGGTPLWEWQTVSEKTVLLLGGEDRGLGQRVRKFCDRLVTIPGTETVGSLNVSVAAGIALYHVMERRRGG